ncbi:hypothetical protein EXIGLDRAFT_758932 [Exidia glandulosa HHB12029]|uniref:F-box domain-containing protein n=1 Tax=Exidia glandulosa HHB12029 TaxID=1314781 RepID=A0A165QGK9_EXIGL|nr:hypothetical protein EXIGLDRAFT_758932 [Exidia glandulosa HHB12029]
MATIPGELVRLILVEAAHIAINSCRPWATELALVSRDVYQLIHPIIYSRLVLTNVNWPVIQILCSEESCTHVFAAIRQLVFAIDMSMIGDIPDRRRSISALVDRLDIARLIAVDGRDLAIHLLASRPGFAPRELALDYLALNGLKVVFDLRPPALASVTHLRILAAYLLEADHSPGASRLVDILLDRLHVLTHLALDITRSETFDNQRPILRDAMESLLRCDRIMLIVCRFVVLHESPESPEWTATIQTCRSMRDARIRIYVDKEEKASDFFGSKLRGKRANAGLSIWDEGEPTLALDA